MATMSALDWLTRLIVCNIVATAKTRELANGSMDEIIALAAARGVELHAVHKSKIYSSHWKMDTYLHGTQRGEGTIKDTLISELCL